MHNDDEYEEQILAIEGLIKDDPPNNPRKVSSMVVDMSDELIEKTREVTPFLVNI